MNNNAVLSLSFFILSLVMVGCDRKDASSILKNNEVRRELYSGILANHEYLKELMDSMRTSEHAGMMIHHDSAMSRKFMSELETQVMVNHLMARTEKDSSACKVVCNSMMNHKKMMTTMLETLGEKGVVKKGCMMEMNAKKVQAPVKQKHH